MATHTANAAETLPHALGSHFVVPALLSCRSGAIGRAPIPRAGPAGLRGGCLRPTGRAWGRTWPVRPDSVVSGTGRLAALSGPGARHGGQARPEVNGMKLK